MQRLFFHLQCLVIGCALLECSVASHADSCVTFHKRAPVRAVWGRVINVAGEKLNNVDLPLTGETGSVLFATRSDTTHLAQFQRATIGCMPKRPVTAWLSEKCESPTPMRKNARLKSTLHWAFGCVTPALT